MWSSRAFRVSLVCILSLVGAACSGGAPIPGPSPTNASSISSPATSSSPTGSVAATTPTPSPTTPASSVAATAPVWPIEPRTIASAASGRSVAVLKAIRTGRHGSYERLVLEFTSSYGEAKVRFAPVVRADPSGKVVSLKGLSFLVVVVQGAVANWPSAPTPYTGPSTLTPGYPTLKQVSISGDFEAVLSFGVGLGRTAGFRVERLRSPDRLVVDVAESPAWRMWPDDNLAMARVEQTAFDQGHQPWRVSAQEVAAAYARAVYGWSNAVVTRAPGIDAYRLTHQGSSDHLTIRAVRLFPTTSRNSIVEIADTR
jgi:hypothetical protein